MKATMFIIDGIGHLSIEMKNTGDMEKVRKVIEYVKEIFA